jgi:hypothetical protein
MLGANNLALEALTLFPVIERGHVAVTTAFARHAEVASAFIWPIWTAPVAVDVLRTLLSLELLRRTPAPRATLAAMGIAEVFRSARVQSSKYYGNLAPAHPCA